MKKSYSYKNNWLSSYFYPKFHESFALEVSPAGYFDNRLFIHIKFIFFQLFLHLPIRSKYDDCDPPCYFKIYYYDNSLVMGSGKKLKFIYMPWKLEWYRRSILLKDGTWEHEIKGKERKDFYEDKWKEKKFSELHPYAYRLKNGSVQNVTARISVEEMEWRRKWLMKFKFFNKNRKSISVDFDGEVGERAGSWKGGTTGCGYEMLENEKPYETLKRMMKEREFN